MVANFNLKKSKKSDMNLRMRSHVDLHHSFKDLKKKFLTKSFIYLSVFLEDFVSGKTKIDIVKMLMFKLSHYHSVTQRPLLLQTVPYCPLPLITVFK